MIFQVISFFFYFLFEQSRTGQSHMPMLLFMIVFDGNFPSIAVFESRPLRCAARNLQKLLCEAMCSLLSSALFIVRLKSKSVHFVHFPLTLTQLICDDTIEYFALPRRLCTCYVGSSTFATKKKIFYPPKQIVSKIAFSPNFDTIEL